MSMQIRTFAVVSMFALALAGCAAGDGDDGGGGGSDTPTCGNGVCEAGEQGLCTADCPAQPVCGDGACAASETITSCAADCSATLSVHNTSTKSVWYLYVAACGDPDWGTDQLGSNVITSGSTFHLHGIPPGCWGFKAVSSTADNVQWVTPTGVTLTAGQDYTWTLTN